MTFRPTRLAAAALTFAIAGLAHAGPITVTNHSFEQPGGGKIADGFDGARDVPGWSMVGTPNDSGTEAPGYATPTEGTYVGFLEGDDGLIFQTTQHVVAAGEQFTLLVDLIDVYGDGQATLRLYYLDGANRVTAAAQTYSTLPDSTYGGGSGAFGTDYSVTFNADSLPAAIGKQIGIEIDNPNGAGTYLGFDNVRLNVAVPEPASLALVALGGLAMLKRRR